MNSLSTRLRRAVPADAAVALGWTPESEELCRWAGPGTRCSAAAASLWEDIATPDATTFVLASAEHPVVGFGQVKYREQRFGHLARIIVAPEWRHRGMGRELCLSLMREATRLHPTIEAFTLYVYPDNAPAIGLYHALGYQVIGAHPTYNNLLMQAPLTAVASGAA